MNILWLMDLRLEVACELIHGRQVPDGRLDLMFDEVVRRPRPQGSFHLDLTDGAVDLLLPYELLSEVLASGGPASDMGSPITVLQECRRVLRDGGAVVFPFENRPWYRGLMGRPGTAGRSDDWPGAVGMGSVKRALRKAGFRVMRFYLSPSRPGHPVSLIPCHPKAILADREMAGGDRLLQRLAAMGLARAGLQSHLYRFAFAVAYR